MSYESYDARFDKTKYAHRYDPAHGHFYRCHTCGIETQDDRTAVHAPDCSAAWRKSSNVPTDTDIIEWLERQHTLHRSVEQLYVVDGYEVSVVHDSSIVHAGPFKAETLRGAYQKAMLEWDCTHGNVWLLKDKIGPKWSKTL